MKRLVLALAGLLASPMLSADCKSDLPLAGTVSVESCTKPSADCISASKALNDYANAPDNDDSVLSIGLQSSPWRLYGPDLRIMRVGELAKVIRANLKPSIKHVRLDGSWTGVSPDKSKASLAGQLSKALDGFPVDGANGFLWMGPDGRTRTTQQAFTVRRGAGSYFIPRGKEVMVSLVEGQVTEQQAALESERNSEGVLHAGVGWDVYGLCPDKALAAFESAAKLGSSIAAYNAALIRLERNAKGDREAARVLLKRAVELKDARAPALLAEMK